MTDTPPTTGTMQMSALDEEVCRIVGDSNQRERWLELRKTGIGASDIAVVLGVSTFRSALDLYAEKTGKKEADDLSDNEFIFWGNKLEPVILEAYRERTGRPAEPAGKLLQSREEQWALCTLDGFTGDESGETWPLEIKTAAGWKSSDWEEGPPEQYYLQIQHQIMVTGAPRATIACLLGGNRLVWCDVERDEIAIRRIKHAGREFWRMVVEEIPPEPDGSANAGKALQSLYPEYFDGGRVELGAEYDDLFDELSKLKADIKESKAIKDEMEQRFKAEIGDQEMAVMPSGAIVRWKNRRGTIDWKAYALDMDGTEREAERHRRKNTRSLTQKKAKD